MRSDDSGVFVRRRSRNRSPDLRSALDRWEKRWSAAAVAAALTMPEDICATVLEWAELLDRLDDGVRDAVYP